MPYPSNVDPGYGILYFNVHDYGAVGDGSTDDALAIQTCINASTSESIIYFPPGTYIVGTVIHLLENRTYLGTNSSEIKMKNGANLVAVIASDAWLTNNISSGLPIKISNLIIDGNSSNNSSGHGIVLMNFDSMIRECIVQNCVGDGITISSVNQSGTSISNTCEENRIESCNVTSCQGYGIRGHDNNGKLIDGYIDSCIVSEVTLDAISIDRGTGFTLSGNYCFDIQRSGISVNNCFNTFITNNKIYNYGQNVSGNTFIAGIDASIIGPSPSVISGNIISSSEPAAGYHYRHISVTFAGVTDTRCLLMDNTIEGSWDSNPNNPSSPSRSLGLNIDANGTQTGGGQPATIYAANNSYDNVGTNLAFNTYISTGNLEQLGDVRLYGHLRAKNSLFGAPVLAALANNGTSAPAPIFSLIGGTDVRGYVKFGSGGGPSAGDQVSVTFAQAYATAAPIVVATAQNAATAALGVYVSSVSTTGFNIATQNAPTASQALATYDVAFIVIG